MEKNMNLMNFYLHDVHLLIGHGGRNWMEHEVNSKYKMKKVHVLTSNVCYKNNVIIKKSVSVKSENLIILIV